jgi:alkyl hydroperoxide reductase subunit AhpC
MLRINDEAPNFTAETSQGTINFHEWIGNGWAILFSHPKDFTPVCTTELGYMAGLQPEFEKRNCKIIGLSVDPVSSHSKWAVDIEETQGHKVKYPMIGDPELKIAKLYDMLPADAGDTSEGRTAATNATVRTVFVVGPDKKIKLMLSYPMSTGRNFDEVLRVVDSMQLTAKHKVATPVNWKQGDDVIILPAVSEEEAKQKVSRRLEGAPALSADRSPAEVAVRKRGGAVILKQFYLPCLAHASYLIGDEATGTAAVVDPQRDTDQYIAFAAEHALKIKHVFLTHLHADFVAGHLELRDRVGAKSIWAPRPKRVRVYSSSRRRHSRIRARAPEGAGNAGPHSGIDLHRRLRPERQRHAAARRAHRRHFVHRRRRAARSARGAGLVGHPAWRHAFRFAAHKLLALPDQSLVYPAHGAGSLCGKALSKETVSTLGGTAPLELRAAAHEQGSLHPGGDGRSTGSSGLLQL